MNEQLPITLRKAAQYTWTTNEQDATYDQEAQYLRVSPQWELRLVATIENDLMPLKPSEIPEGGGIFRTPVAVQIVAEGRYVDDDGQPEIQKSTASGVVFALEQSAAEVLLPAMPPGLEIDETQQQEFTQLMRNQIERWQMTGWERLENITIDANTRYWPDQGYVRYLIYATQMAPSKLAEKIGVSEHTLDSWQDPKHQRSIPYAAQYLLEVIARARLQERDRFNS